jgi:hypothetical protein
MSGPVHRLPGGKGYLRPSTGEVFPGVTTLIKALDSDPGPLIGWATKTTAQAAVSTREEWEPLSTRAEAESLIKAHARRAQSVKRDLGTAVHDAIEQAFQADLEKRRRPTPHPKVKPYLDGLESFTEETGFTPLALEVTVLSSEHRYAGTLDAVGQVGSEVVMVDWKSGSLRATMAAQLLLLQEADVVLHDDGTETPFLGAERLWIVQVSPADYSVHEVQRDGVTAERLATILPQVSDLSHTLGALISKRPEPVRL